MSDNTFTLTIHLGNDAMQDRDDVAAALRNVAAQVSVSGNDNGTVRDDNGNRVGLWAFSTELIGKPTPNCLDEGFFCSPGEDNKCTHCGEDWTAYEDDDQRLGGNDNPYDA